MGLSSLKTPAKMETKATANIAVVDEVAGAWTVMPVHAAPIRLIHDNGIANLEDLDEFSEDDRESMDTCPSLHPSMPSLITLSSSASDAVTNSSKAKTGTRCSVNPKSGYKDDPDAGAGSCSLVIPLENDATDINSRTERIMSWVADVAMALSPNPNPTLQEPAVCLNPWRVSVWVFALMAMSPKTQEVCLTYILDSGATHHMSPYRDAFTRYRTLDAKPLRAANQQEFYAVGIGDMVIHIPNGPKVSQITLKDVLHTLAH